MCTCDNCGEELLTKEDEGITLTDRTGVKVVIWCFCDEACFAAWLNSPAKREIWPSMWGDNMEIKNWQADLQRKEPLLFERFCYIVKGALYSDVDAINRLHSYLIQMAAREKERALDPRAYDKKYFSLRSRLKRAVRMVFTGYGTKF